MQGHLTAVPLNVTVCEKEPVVFACATNLDDPVNWDYIPRDSTKRLKIYSAGELVDEYRHQINTSKHGQYDLVLNSVSQKDFGKYICVDETGIGEEAAAELIVLGRVNFTAKYAFIINLIFTTDYTINATMHRKCIYPLPPNLLS